MNDIGKMRRAIMEAMEYAVTENDRAAAEDLLDIYRDDRIGLAVLSEFYNYLPEAREAWVREIRLVQRHRGIFLLAAVTAEESYFYLVSSEGIEFHGNLSSGYLADELLDFFGYESASVFQQSCSNVTALPIYEPLQLEEEICPACHAETGEYHELGCPVEVCPWCGGQLISCDCRYEKLGLDSLESDADLVQFEAILEDQGRIPYSREQRPSFADDGPNIVFD